MEIIVWFFIIIFVIYSLSNVVVDRFVVIMLFLYYYDRMILKRCLLMIIFLWFFVFMGVFIVYFIFFKYVVKIWMCGGIIFVLILFCIIVFCYFKIYKVIRSIFFVCENIINV